MRNREAFEEWYSGTYRETIHILPNGQYASLRQQHSWDAWQARVPEGYVVVPKEPTEQILNRMTNAPIEVNHLCDNADIFLSEDEARIAYKAMIEAQEQDQ